MTTPAPRTPVRPGRGTKANLNTALAAGDIKEGEIVYAKDEDKLYVVESGAFVAIGGGTGGAVVINDLTDVDTVTSAPTSDQVLSWDSVASQWTPSDRRGAIEFVGISSSLEAVYDQATLSHTLPSNIKKGDLILLYVGHRSGTASTTSLLNTPSGYTKRTERTYTSTSSTSSSISHTLFTKIAVGNESGTTVSVTAVTSTAGDDWYAASQVYRNAEYVAVSTEDTVAAPGGLQTGYATVASLTDYNVLYSAHAINVYAFSTNHAHRFLTETGLEMRHLQPLVNVPAAKRQHSWYQTAGVFKVAAANSSDYFDTATVANLTDGFHFMFTKLKPA